MEHQMSTAVLGEIYDQQYQQHPGGPGDPAWHCGTSVLSSLLEVANTTVYLHSGTHLPRGPSAGQRVSRNSSNPVKMVEPCYGAAHGSKLFLNYSQHLPLIRLNKALHDTERRGLTFTEASVACVDVEYWITFFLSKHRTCVNMSHRYCILIMYTSIVFLTFSTEKLVFNCVLCPAITLACQSTKFTIANIEMNHELHKFAATDNWILLSNCNGFPLHMPAL